MNKEQVQSNGAKALSLPKIRKRIHGGMIKLEKIQKVIAGIGLVLGTTLTGITAGDVQASVSYPSQLAPSMTTGQPSDNGALLLIPSFMNQELLASHHSHRSHYSHRSHHSHYSSRH